MHNISMPDKNKFVKAVSSHMPDLPDFAGFVLLIKSSISCADFLGIGVAPINNIRNKIKLLYNRYKLSLLIRPVIFRANIAFKYDIIAVELSNENITQLMTTTKNV